MDILGLVFFVTVGIILILIGVLYLGGYLLKRKVKPDEEYLNEIKEVKVIKRLNFINSIIIFMVIIIQKFNEKATLFLIPVVIIELIRNKYILSYLKTKNESNSTQKYILYNLYFQAIVLIVGLGLYLILLNF
ncbi:MAG: hypothetical protein RSD22_08535 [Romboutsia sp.]